MTFRYDEDTNELIHCDGVTVTKIRLHADDADVLGLAADKVSGGDYPAPTGNFRRFELVRHEDNTGTSGTGVVALGVEYPDGAVHMQWRNDDNPDLDTFSNGVAFKPAPDGIAATEEFHGHDGRTEIRWIDDD